jgi:hypothetical protein
LFIGYPHGSNTTAQTLLTVPKPCRICKANWYKRQKGEFIKDILSLTNGDASTAGDTAYLIFGADDELDSDGRRQLFDIADKLPNRDSIHQLVNAACSPRLEYLEADVVEIDGKRLFVLTIPPSPHLYETTGKLETKSQTYTEHVVFIRLGAMVGVASAKERAAILELKQLRFAEARNAPPIPFGTGVGALAGGAIGKAWADSVTDKKLENLVLGVGGAVIGGLLGGLAGNSYQQVRQFATDLHYMPRQKRVPAVLLVASATTGMVIAANKIAKKLESTSLYKSLFQGDNTG